MAGNKELWQARINDYRASNKTAKLWCKENNITASTLKYWITKLNKEKANSFDNPEFVPITAENTNLKLHLPATIRFGKISIDIQDGCQPNTIRTILDILNSYV